MMNVTSLVSVIIPTYNRPELVVRSIESVLSQTYKNVEVLVVDDASDDNGATLENINKLSDSRVKYIRHSERMHRGAARNTGIDEAAGKYLCFLDSDDVWLENKLEDYLTSPPNKNEILYGKLQKVGNQKGVFPARAKDEAERVGDYLFVAGGSMQTSTLMMQAKLAKAIRFNPKLTRFQDYDFVIRAESNGVIFRYIEGVLVHQFDCDQGNRISNSYDYETARYWIESMKDQVSKKSYRRFYINRVCHYAVMSGDKRQAMRSLLSVSSSLAYEPLLWGKYLLVIIIPTVLRKKIIKLIKQKRA